MNKYLPLIILLLVGCNDKHPETIPQPQEYQLPLKVRNIDSSRLLGFLKEIEFKNHQYLLIEKFGATSLTHSESCPCKNK